MLTQLYKGQFNNNNEYWNTNILWQCRVRVVGGDEKGSLKSETVIYCRESQGIRTKERLRWQWPAAYTKDIPDLSSERAPRKNKIVTVTQVIKIWW
jgi:hypothetical protein